MNLMIKNRPTHVIPQPFGNDPYFADRIGLWAYVTEVNSRNNSCSIITDTGLRYKNIPVASREWVNTDNLAGERNLPPVNSRVFVMMPTGTMSGAFILCSGYATGETDSHNLYAKNDGDKDYYNKTKEVVTQGGWVEKENQETGNRSIESKDGKIKIEMYLADNSGKEESKHLQISAWDQVITITENGVQITAKKKVTLKTEDGLEIDGNNKAIEIKNANTFKVNNNLEVSP